MRKIMLSMAVLAAFGFAGCKGKKAETPKEEPLSEIQQKVNEFALIQLTTDLSILSEKEKQILPLFIEIANIMDELFWIQAYGNKTDFDTISDAATKEFVSINYGPWNRLDDMKPFVSGFGEKPAGANFYPHDITKEEFDALKDPKKSDQYTIIQRNEKGELIVVPYREAYKEPLSKAIKLMKEAVELAENKGLKKYLEERIKAFETDDYLASDMTWMDMKDSKIDFVVGPIENYEDKLFAYKASYEAFILIKDEKWSADLARFTKMLPELQTELPCDPKYKKEVPGTDSDLNVYDVIYYGGDCNAGSKTIAINLPNDERVHLKKGTRRLQLKNAMKAKFDNILLPIAEQVVVKEQLSHVKFDAFFWNVTFHEVAHGLGIKKTVSGKGNVRQALKEQYTGWEEAKADILGLFMVHRLIEKGEITNITVEDAYTTFIAGILRSVRFGAASAHGKANMMCFNFFEDKGAFSRNEEGLYVINLEKAKQALVEWAGLVLKIEGEGDYEFAKKYQEENSTIRPALEKDLAKIQEAHISLDIRFDQGKSALGL